MTIIRELPQHILASIFARLQRLGYPNLAIVCREFRQVIALPEINVKRLEIGNNESVLYGLIGVEPSHRPSWYILNNINGSLRLSWIRKLADRPEGSAVVTIGFYMYVFGGNTNNYPTRSVSRIDCRTHEIQELPSMSRGRYRAAAAVVDGKIYVIGGCEMEDTNDWAEVYDVKKESWSALPGPYPLGIHREETRACVVMEGKICILYDDGSCLTYEPQNGTWVSLRDELIPLNTLWRPCSCVVDDVLYSVDPLGLRIDAFDPKENEWRPVEIIGNFPVYLLLFIEAKMANVGGKLMILAANWSHTRLYHNEQKEIWCIEITPEIRQDGQFRWTVEKVECVLKSDLARAPLIDHCLAVTLG